MNPNSFEKAISIGQEGVENFYKQNYLESKDKCVQACRLLQEMLNESQSNKKNIIKGYLIQFLTIAESASEKLNKQPLQKTQSIDNNLFVQQIESNMIVSANTSFDDIVGLDNIKTAIKEAIIYPRMRPDLYKGIRAPPRGILFYGPPGNGKTLMAKAVAHECKSTFFNVTAASLLSKWVGDSERMLKTIFSQAYRRQPSIIFFDQIDAILSSRSEAQHDASRRLKTEFLVQLDGVSTTDKDNVLLIAATNLPNQLDKAALRRFTKKVLIDLPDYKAKKHMIKKEMEKVKSKLSDKNIDDIVYQLELYSAADVKNLIKQAAMMPLRDYSYEQLLEIDKNTIRAVTKQDFMKAMKICAPTLNKKQYQKYRSFGEEQGAAGKKQLTVSCDAVQNLQKLNSIDQENNEEQSGIQKINNLFKTQQIQPKTLKERVLEQHQIRQYQKQQQREDAFHNTIKDKPPKKKSLWAKFWNWL